MDIKKLARILQTIKAGEFHTVEWNKELKTRKGIDAVVTKNTVGKALRVGVAYDNKQAVKTKRELGILPTENKGLPYGTWRAFPYLIKHNGKLQLRVTTAQNTRFLTEYFINGVKAERKDIVELVLKSEIGNGDEKQIDVFNLKIENIIAIR